MAIVVVLVSGRCFPRNICVHDQEPAKNIMGEKSGRDMGTCVGAGAGDAAEVNGIDASPKIKAITPSAASAACFILNLSKGTSCALRRISEVAGAIAAKATIAGTARRIAIAKTHGGKPAEARPPWRSPLFTVCASLVESVNSANRYHHTLRLLKSRIAIRVRYGPGSPFAV